jgi:DNA polymerase-3 subunit delta
MVALKSFEVDKFIARPDPARPVALVFGSDSGLVRERVAALVHASVDDPADPFQLARLEGDDLASAPTRLVEEANTIPLFGGRRAVWVKPGGRNIAPAVEAVLASAASGCRVVIEAGDLKRSSPLRALCERAKNAVALPCYPDDEKALARLIDDQIRAAGLSIAPDARAALLPLLGGDRLATRRELDKLLLFAHGKSRVELADVMAVVADASSLAIDALVDAAFAGRMAELEAEFGKARTAGTAPGTIIAAALRHVAQLHKAQLAIEAGASTDAAMAGIQPLHFSRKPAVEAALRLWTAARLERTMAQLADDALDARKRPTLADALAQRALLMVATNARRKE